MGITYIDLRHAVRIDAAIFHAPLPAAKRQNTECSEESGLRTHQAALLHSLAASMRLFLYVRSAAGAWTSARESGCLAARNAAAARVTRTAAARSLGYELQPHARWGMH